MREYFAGLASKLGARRGVPEYGEDAFIAALLILELHDRHLINLDLHVDSIKNFLHEMAVKPFARGKDRFGDKEQSAEETLQKAREHIEKNIEQNGNISDQTCKELIIELVSRLSPFLVLFFAKNKVKMSGEENRQIMDLADALFNLCSHDRYLKSKELSRAYGSFLGVLAGGVFGAFGVVASTNITGAGVLAISLASAAPPVVFGFAGLGVVIAANRRFTAGTPAASVGDLESLIERLSSAQGSAVQAVPQESEDQAEAAEQIPLLQESGGQAQAVNLVFGLCKEILDRYKEITAPSAVHVEPAQAALFVPVPSDASKPATPSGAQRVLGVSS